MVKDPQVFLKHIRDYCEKVTRIIDGHSFDEFAKNEEVHFSVMKILEIIGEACNNLTDDFQKSHPEIPWAQIIGFRNKTTHEYWDIDLKIVWRIASVDAPELHDKIIPLIHAE